MNQNDNAAPLERRVRRDQNEAEAVALGSLDLSRDEREKKELSELNLFLAGKTVKSIQYSGHWDSVFISFVETTQVAQVGTDCGLYIEILNEDEVPESLKTSR